ncbi:uncharacterized protein CLUP02_04263 [Colletotrichum lupini]|uniref:Uncharacterized protein n=1 Tax=Colletotrichum lupini TaxID=145971 RepID=A0A9Q8WD49_9PEZI|nr:uncharacterized protein CLUP02_04263 [Colletotrichum lupini]UQC78786.1 hypothetical protein CLUP02_04263 [Colletotrichum lupini]
MRSWRALQMRFSLSANDWIRRLCLIPSTWCFGISPRAILDILPTQIEFHHDNYIVPFIFTAQQVGLRLYHDEKGVMNPNLHQSTQPAKTRSPVLKITLPTSSVAYFGFLVFLEAHTISSHTSLETTLENHALLYTT